MFIAHTTASGSSGRTDDEKQVANQIAADPVVRRRQLKTIADLGLEHMK